jgi:hypothetical protein
VNAAAIVFWAAAAALPREPGEPVSGGEHWRLLVLGSPVHVYRPHDFDPRTAGIVVYAHGYFDNLDTIWKSHQLVEQFKKSGRNALFVASEAPINDDDKVVHWHLGWLLHEVFRGTGIERPRGDVVAVAHSGGFRVLIEWIKRHNVGEVVLIDGLYQNEQELLSWLRAHSGRRLTLVSIDTKAKADAFIAKLDKKTLAKVLDVRPVIDHMGVITGGRVLPEVISCTRLEPLLAAVSER